MAFISFYRDYENLLAETYPSSQSLLDQLQLDRLISPHRLKLSKKTLTVIKEAISAHHSFVSRKLQTNIFGDEFQWLWPQTRPFDSVLTAYDFHTTTEGNAHLVEINTNASAFLLSELIYKAHGLPTTWEGQPFLEALRHAFNQHLPAERQISSLIIDEDIANQKMLVEFYLYRDLFKTWGWQADICDADKISSDDLKKTNFIYNRLTDFYFTDSRWAWLREAYRNPQVGLSPHPKSYLLFADKKRLAEMSRPGYLETQGASEAEIAAIRKVLIPTQEIGDFASAESLWEKRKHLFFKPRQAYGSKSAYRGSSVSRKVFERLLQEDTVIQEYVPAQSWPVTKETDYLANWKFDLRVYVYGAQIHMVVARMYQGQVTNFSSPNGGLTAVEFI